MFHSHTRGDCIPHSAPLKRRNLELLPDPHNPDMAWSVSDQDSALVYRRPFVKMATYLCDEACFDVELPTGSASSSHVLPASRMVMRPGFARALWASWKCRKVLKIGCGMWAR